MIFDRQLWILKEIKVAGNVKWIECYRCLMFYTWWLFVNNECAYDFAERSTKGYEKSLRLVNW